MILSILIGYISLFTILAIVYAPVMWFIQRRGDINALEDFVNRRFNDRKLIGIFQIAAYAAVIAWIMVAFPVIDFTTFGFVTTLDDTALHTLLGDVPRKLGDFYILAMFMNILGAKAALKMAELAGVLKTGPVEIRKIGIFLIWSRLR
jgi:hypothetical protein